MGGGIMGVKWKEVAEGGFYGRTVELRWVEDQLNRGRSVIVTGEPGVGRRTLVRQVEFSGEIEWTKMAARHKKYSEFAAEFKGKVVTDETVFICDIDLLLALCLNPALVFENAALDDPEMCPIEVLRKALDSNRIILIATAADRGANGIFTDTFGMAAVHLKTMDVEKAKSAIRAGRKNLESKFGVRVADSAIHAAVHLSEDYMSSGGQPHKAMNVLESACKVASDRDALVTDENIFTLVATWTRISPDKLRKSRHQHRRQSQRRRLQRSSVLRAASHRVTRVCSEANLRELRWSPSGSGLNLSPNPSIVEDIGRSPGMDELGRSTLDSNVLLL